MPQRDIWVGVSSICSSLSINSHYPSSSMAILHPDLTSFTLTCGCFFLLLEKGIGLRKVTMNRCVGLDVCFDFIFPTFSSQTSQAWPHRSEEWSWAVEAVLQRRGDEGVEVGSIHIRFELSPHFTGLQRKQLLLTLMLDIPKYKKAVLCRHKRHGSHYIGQIAVYQVIVSAVFCFIAV